MAGWFKWGRCQGVSLKGKQGMDQEGPISMKEVLSNHFTQLLTQKMVSL